MKFNSRKDALFSTVILLSNSLVIAIIIFGLQKDNLGPLEYLMMLLLVSLVGLLFWIFFGTCYSLTNTSFFYRSGPFKDEIALNSITEIIKDKTLWIGMRPATARKGLIIKYNKYDEVYISPNTNARFIQEILSLNKDIKISE